MIREQDIEQAIENLGVQNSIICIHSSLKSFGDKLENGCQTLLNGFMNKKCTVMVPSFTYEYTVQPAAGQMPGRNGCNYETIADELPKTASVFTTETDDISVKEMGVFPAFIVKKEGRIRGNHPINSFTAVGGEAESLIQGQTPDNVYAPFEEMYKMGGYVLLMGVNLCEATVLHYAEQIAGRNLFLQWAMGENGGVVPVKVGSCSDGFEKLSPFLDSVVKRTMVGGSNWLCFDIRKLIPICAEIIRTNPEITHCARKDCIRCRDAVKGGPIY